MDKTKKIYFLFSFVMIIACYALNKSYSMFVASEEKNVVDSVVPNLVSELSVSSVTLSGNEEYLIKQTITNTSSVSINYALNANGSNYTIKMTSDEGNKVLGSLETNQSDIVYLYVKNDSTESNTITFELNKNYTTLNNDLTSNIDNTNLYTPVTGTTIPYQNEPNTLKYHILNNYINSDLYTGTVPSQTNTTAVEAFSGKTENTIKLPLSSGTITLPEPPTKIAEEISGPTENIISQTEDDYGTSYYFRGNVIDNYVDFAGMCWRIVRINGDGNIKLLLEDKNSTCASSNSNWYIPTMTGGVTMTGNFGYTIYPVGSLSASDGTTNTHIRYLMNYLNSEANPAGSMATAFKNFQEETNGDNKSLKDKISLTYQKDINEYLKASDWCLDDKGYLPTNDYSTVLTSAEILDRYVAGEVIYYDSYVRLYWKKDATLKCNGTNMSKFADGTDMYVGTLTADEIVYAGGKLDTKNLNYYLMSAQNSRYRTLSPSWFDGTSDLTFSIYEYGKIDYSRPVNDNNYLGLRPAITLLSKTRITDGIGTKVQPYIIQ